MPNQDLLFPILPRAPMAPSPRDIKREVTQISQKHRLRKAHSDGGGGQPQPQTHPPLPHDQDVGAGDDQRPDPEHKIDLFV